MQAGPETLFRDFVAAGNFQFVEALKEFDDGLEIMVANDATSQDEIVNAYCAAWKVLGSNKSNYVLLK